MPIEVGIWKIKDEVERLNFNTIESEKKLENIIEQDISILSDQLLLIGRQIQTDYGKFIDLLAMDVDGNLVIIELKKNKTPREVVAQTLDYASWVETLSYDDVVGIFEENNPKYSLEERFYDHFELNIPEAINESHNIIIVASELDSETERIINYLSDSYNVPINASFFRYFEDDGNEYLTRSWLIDPKTVSDKTNKSKTKKESWNGNDFVVNLLDDGKLRTWNDCVKYGFVSAGQGKWYSRTLKSLFPGARIFCMIPGEGYVGVGIVKKEAVPVTEFEVEFEGENKNILDVRLKATDMGRNKEDLDLCEYVVRIDWIKTEPRKEAYWEKGLKANQNTAFKLKSKFTIEKLTEHFNLED